MERKRGSRKKHYMLSATIALQAFMYMGDGGAGRSVVQIPKDSAVTALLTAWVTMRRPPLD
eukprot:1044388-Pyramimonas_sp.AAC.1